MEKWADFVIVAVRYDDNNEYVVSVMRLKDQGKKLTASAIRSRSVIVKAISMGITYATAHKSPSSKKYRKGAMVKMYDDKYLKISADTELKDDLGNLPRF